jgi:Ca2+-binding EF-hand superfamily protein
MSQKKA